MKTPEEIKRWLEECGYKYGACGLCPYDRPGCGITCMAEMKQDAFDYIEQLEREKAALLEIADKACRYCKHDHDLSANSPCNKCTTKNVLWEWRGVEGTE